MWWFTYFLEQHSIKAALTSYLKRRASATTAITLVEDEKLVLISNPLPDSTRDVQKLDLS